ncbi:MAG: cbb3-type cytochrome c oxidase subunit I [Gemmatimonadota bacterium]
MVRVPVSGAEAGRRPLAWLALLALGACAVVLVSGSGAALMYTDAYAKLRSLGLGLQNFRPIHTTFAFAWVFLGGVAVVHHYLGRTFGPPGRAVRRRMAWQTALWAGAGAGILATLLAGRFTGREYMGYDPLLALPILAGWILFAWNFFGQRGVSLRGQPVYVYMWSVAIPLFVITYLEGNLYLLDLVSARPVRDLAIQWKSTGTIVGAFNLLAYGSLMYVSGCIRGDDEYAYSRTAFALFVVGLLNTFTNYGHHTYHLPQTAWIHWISFAVSMLETIILAKVFVDLVPTLRAVPARDDLRVPDLFLKSGAVWTFLLMILAIGISVPPLNALIHGTHVVVAHSMGSMIGIDSMILWAALSYMLGDVAGREHRTVRGARVRAAVPWVSVFLLVFLLSYLARGAAAGWVRYVGPSAPDFSPLFKMFPIVMVASGVGLTLTVLWFLLQWIFAFGAVALGGARPAAPVPQPARTGTPASPPPGEAPAHPAPRTPPADRYPDPVARRSRR